MDSQALEFRIRQLDAWIRGRQTEALARFRIHLPEASLHSFHAHIGRHNNTFVDSVRFRFSGPQDFISRWIQGLSESLNRFAASGRPSYGLRLSSEQLIVRCLQDEVLKQYVFKFLERNFYRNYRERTRQKPDDALWSVWFGAGDLSWGLIIAPAHRNNAWTNDKSQMRRENYTYWTVGHVLETGLHDPSTKDPMKFADVGALVTFYQSILKRASGSLYERAISDLYLNYLLRSPAPLEEPLLIPEFRYAGAERKHEYRLDFTVLNGHTFQFTGFELSPASTHIKADKIAAKTQAELNRGLAAAWQKEVAKRNAYFQTYGVSVVTFADEDLKCIDMCFSKVEAALRARAAPSTSVESALDALTRRHGLVL